MLETKKRALEAMLFVSGGPLDVRSTAQILQLPPDTVEGLAHELTNDYSHRGLQIAAVAGGYQMCTRSEYSTYVEAMLAHEKSRLSRAALETLAVIAYKQPVTKAEVEAIRGVNCDGVIDRLTLHSLVETVGRKDTVGRPLLYGTTSEFLKYFGFSGLNELPHLPEILDGKGEEESETGS